MPIHNIQDHDHEWKLVKTVQHEELNGKTTIKTCRYEECDGKRVEWEDKPTQTTLGQ